MAGLRVPLSTLRRRPCDRQRMTRGRDGWLGLSRVTLAFTTPCRFVPAHCRTSARCGVRLARACRFDRSAQTRSVVSLVRLADEEQRLAVAVLPEVGNRLLSLRRQQEITEPPGRLLADVGVLFRVDDDDAVAV